MRQPAIHKILKDASEITSRPKRIEFLKKYTNNKALLTVLKYTFDPNVEFDLPSGTPPYKPCESLDIENRLYQEMRKMYIFHPNTKVPKVKKEYMFIQILESIDPEDAKVLIGIKDKKLPYKGITAKLVQEAFPNLL